MGPGHGIGTHIDRNKDATRNSSASLLVTSALLVVTKTLLGAPGIATRNKDATRTHQTHHIDNHFN